MSDPNAKLLASETEEESMQIDEEGPEIKTTSGGENEGENSVPQLLQNRGTVGDNGVLADFIEFEVNPDFTLTNSDNRIPRMNMNDSDPKNTSNDNNNNNNNNSNNKKAKAERRAEIRKAYLESLAKKKQGNRKADSYDPFHGITLDSVGGLETQIQWLKQCILKPLKSNRSKNIWGVKPPKGVLFHGPPGCGKTLLARAFGNALSAELEEPVSFFHRKGGDTFSPWFGESSENLRNLFKEAIAEKPSIIFFDELDGLSPSRDGNSTSEAYTTVVTTLLGLMDTLPAGEVFVIGATNRLESVDPAMRRPGRFDKQLEFLPPNQTGRKRILEINTRKWKKSSQLTELSLEKMSLDTVGFTGADLENLCREAFFTAFNRHVPDGDLDATIDDLEVTEEDWGKALKKTKPTNVAVFGSTFYTPSLPNKKIDPLIRNIQVEIAKELIPLLPKRANSSLNGQGDVTSTMFQSLLIWDKGSESVDVLESFIIPGVLSQKLVNELPTYLLSLENIHSEPDSNKLQYITETINQARDSFNPCILFIPRFDNFPAELKGYMEFVSRQLLGLRGKSVLILGTASRPATSLPREFAIQSIFPAESSRQVRKPSKEERLNFYKPTFKTIENIVKNGKVGSDVPELLMAKVAKLFEDCVDKTQGDGIEVILALDGALIQACGPYFKEPSRCRKTLPGELVRLLTAFSNNKLRY